MFQVVIPILNQFEEAGAYLSSWFKLSARPLSIIFIDNGSDSRWVDYPLVQSWANDGHHIRVIRNEENVGVYPTFQQGFDNAHESARWIFYSHSDVEMLVPGWDLVLSSMLARLERSGAGVCGMFGARGIGTEDIYKAPYDLHQMVRWDCHTVASMAGQGGKELDCEFKRIMVLDGFSLIVRRAFINMIGKFDHERYPSHHMYDNDICLMSHFSGFKNYVIDLDCIHHGGVTSTREKWAEKMGTTDLDVHRAAHVVFYEKWRGHLPAYVK